MYNADVGLTRWIVSRMRISAQLFTTVLVAWLLPACGSQAQSPVQAPPPALGSELFLVAELSGEVVGFSESAGQLVSIPGSFITFPSILTGFAADPSGTMAVGFSGSPLLIETLEGASIGAEGVLIQQTGTSMLRNAIDIDVSQQGIIAISTPPSGSVQFFNLQDGQFIAGASVLVGLAPQPIAFSPNGQFLYVGDNASGIISVLSVASASSVQLAGSAQMPFLAGERNPELVRMRVNAAGNMIVTTTFDGRLYLASMNPATGMISEAVEAHTAANANLESVVFDPTSTNVYAADLDNGGIYEFSLTGGSVQPLAGSPLATAPGIADMVSNSAGDRIYVASRTAGIATYSRDLQSGALRALGQSGINGALAFRIVRVPIH